MDLKKYATLLAVVQETMAGRQDAARRVLAELVDLHLDPGAGAEDLQYFLFASALSRRLASDREEGINLYLRQFQQTQISLFNLLAQHLPTVSLAAPLANEILGRFIAGQEEVTLLDVGIGSGRQEVSLLYRLAHRGHLPKRLNVIAVEPDAGSLLEAGSGLAAAAEMLGVDLRFHPVHAVAEDLTDEDWAFFASLGAPMVVLSAFAVHHVRPQAGRAPRDELFHRLRALDPDAVVLCEPNSNHDSPSLLERFQAAWHHFGLTFRLIDELDVAEAEKAAMKMFFAREIEDIVANGEESRCERHEPVEAWVRRMRDAGFTPWSDFGAVHGLEAGPVRLAARGGYLGLDYGDETLVAVIVATSGVAVRTDRIAPALLDQVA